jgi:ABC-type amino acid transport substrate-binding protein
LTAPEKSSEQPHGVEGNLSTKDLSRAINTALTQIQSKGIDDKLASKNHPKELVHAYTCKDDNANLFSLPNKKEATGLLKDVLEKKKLIVLSNGPYDWGDNDGNYYADPPVGFYPDLLDAIVEELKSISGPDKEKYGEIKIERFYTKDAAFPW